jgi:hypothetical protein
MASDSLTQVGKYIRNTNKRADQALKRVTNKIPKKERARDTVSSIYPMSFNVETRERGERVTLDINFNKPPPLDCAAGCIATTCEDYEMTAGGHSISVTNPYEPGSVKVFISGTLQPAQWSEENPEGGQVYVQVSGRVMVVVCYSYIIC